MELPLALVIFGALALIALLTADGRWRWLFLFAKPATTLSLLLVTGMPSQDRFGVLVVGALLLSALGDTALLHDSGAASSWPGCCCSCWPTPPSPRPSCWAAGGARSIPPRWSGFGVMALSPDLAAAPALVRHRARACAGRS